jgi:hypothetical protein
VPRLFQPDRPWRDEILHGEFTFATRKNQKAIPAESKDARARPSSRHRNATDQQAQPGFLRRAAGVWLVKRTLSFDDPGSYHFYLIHLNVSYG